MRAGKLDRSITIQSFSNTVSDDGTPVEAWIAFATVRAEVIQSGTDEFLAGYGESDRTVYVFRIRWLAGITSDHRVQYDGRNLNVRELKEIGRRKGLEIRCEEVRT